MLFHYAIIRDASGTNRGVHSDQLIEPAMVTLDDGEEIIKTERMHAKNRRLLFVELDLKFGERGSFHPVRIETKGRG